jgi:hypothetical protein
MEVELEVTARLCSKAGLYLWDRGQFRQATPLQEQALAIRRRVLGADHPDTLTSMNDLTGVRRELGEL